MTTPTPVVKRANDFSLLVSSIPITHFPATGGVVNIAKVSATSIFIEGLNGQGSTLIMNGQGHSLSVTVPQGTPSQHTLAYALEAQTKFGALPAIFFTRGSVVYASGQIGISAAPDYSVEADNLPPMAYTFTGIFDVVKPGVYKLPVPLTAEQILSMA